MRRAWKMRLTRGLVWALIASSPTPLLAARRRPRAHKKSASAAPAETNPEQKLEAEEKLRIGREALETQHYNAAELAFSSILTFDPRNADALTGAAEAAFENAHYEQALAWIERAVWEAPTVKNYTLLGHADAKLGLFDQAKVAYTKALSLHPGDPDLEEWLHRTEAELNKPASDRTRPPAR
jgi:tetratricopeptide (TPR) repeat protein